MEGTDKGCLTQDTTNKGSITLEATIVFPVFVAFMLCLVNFIKVGMVYIAMDHAVAETTKEIATHAYPLKYLNVSKPTGVEELMKRVVTDPSSVTAKLPSELQSAVVSDITTALGRELGKAGVNLLGPVIEKVARYKIKEMYPLGKLGDESFKITKTIMYNPLDPSGDNGVVNGIPVHGEDVALVVEYKVKILAPFLRIEDITLSNTAVERAWVH